MTTAFVILGIMVLALVAILLVVRRLICICQPNEVLVFSGTRRRMGGRIVGYRLVQGGSSLRLPLLERVDRLDLTNMAIDIKVAGAYSKVGIPLEVEGVANVKIASEEPTIGNALERFLGKPRSEIVRVAKETLEGNLRGVLATLTPEEVNQDRVKFAESLLLEAEQDLRKLGLVLDTLKIQTVSDARGYLDSIGRKQSAEVLMRSRVAEADNRAQAIVRDAQNTESKALRRIEAEEEVARADAGRRVVAARTRGEAMVAEARAEVGATLVRARADLAVQAARVDKTRLELEADRIRPAEAHRARLVQEARGDAAKVVEDARATASSLRQLAAVWTDGGEDARRLVVAQNLRPLVQRLLETVKDLPIDRVTVVDGSGGAASLASTALRASAELEAAVGLKVPNLLARLSGTAS